MTPRILAASGILLAGLSGAARAAERPWIEVRSANFQVLSDASEREARGVALRFEQAPAGQQAAAGAADPTTARRGAEAEGVRGGIPAGVPQAVTR